MKKILLFIFILGLAEQGICSTNYSSPPQKRHAVYNQNVFDNKNFGCTIRIAVLETKTNGEETLAYIEMSFNTAEECIGMLMFASLAISSQKIFVSTILGLM